MMHASQANVEDESKFNFRCLACDFPMLLQEDAEEGKYFCHKADPGKRCNFGIAQHKAAKILLAHYINAGGAVSIISHSCNPPLSIESCKAIVDYKCNEYTLDLAIVNATGDIVCCFELKHRGKHFSFPGKWYGFLPRAVLGQLDLKLNTITLRDTRCCFCLKKKIHELSQTDRFQTGYTVPVEYGTQSGYSNPVNYDVPITYDVPTKYGAPVEYGIPTFTTYTGPGYSAPTFSGTSYLVPNHTGSGYGAPAFSGYNGPAYINPTFLHNMYSIHNIAALNQAAYFQHLTSNNYLTPPLPKTSYNLSPVRRVKSVPSLKRDTSSPRVVINKSEAEIVMENLSLESFEDSSKEKEIVPSVLPRWGDDSPRSIEFSSMKKSFQETSLDLATELGCYGIQNEWNNSLTRIAIFRFKDKKYYIRNGWTAFPEKRGKRWNELYIKFQKQHSCLKCGKECVLTYPDVYCDTCYKDIKANKFCVVKEKYLNVDLLDKIMSCFSWLENLPIQIDKYGPCCFCQRDTVKYVWYSVRRPICSDCVVFIHQHNYPGGQYFKAKNDDLEQILTSYGIYP
jgi:hypothetical protein